MTIPEYVDESTVPESAVDKAAQLRTDLRRLSSTATRLKLDLHDLAEDLPVGWERIMDLATDTYSAHRAIARLRLELAALESA